VVGGASGGWAASVSGGGVEHWGGVMCGVRTKNRCMLDNDE